MYNSEKGSFFYKVMGRRKHKNNYSFTNLCKKYKIAKVLTWSGRWAQERRCREWRGAWQRSAPLPGTPHYARQTSGCPRIACPALGSTGSSDSATSPTTVTTIMTTTMITTATMIIAATMRITATVKWKCNNHDGWENGMTETIIQRQWWRAQRR